MTALPAALLFDLDETILSFGARPLLLEETAQAFGPDFGDISPRDAAQGLEAAFKVFWSDAERHRQWRFQLEQARIHIVAQVFEGWRDRAPGLTPQVARAFAERFHHHRESQAAFFPGALEAIVALREAGVRLALVTNGAAAPQRAKVERFDLARCFDHVQIEGEAGFGKPEERAYRHALQALGVEAREAWMVGDNLEWEVAAPQRLGIYAIWHDHLGAGLPPGSPIVPDRIITSVAQLSPGAR
jgi:putative hydrolase of the HAD superfamily